MLSCWGACDFSCVPLGPNTTAQPRLEGVSCSGNVIIRRCLLCHMSPCAPAPHLGLAQVYLTRWRSAR